MAQAAWFEEKEGREVFRTNEFYIGDYVSLHMVKALVTGTFSFVVLLGLWEAAQILWAVAQFSAPLPVALALAGWETLVTLVWAFPVYGFHRFCCVHYGRIYHE